MRCFESRQSTYVPATKRLEYVSEFATKMSSAGISRLSRLSAERNRADEFTGMLIAAGELDLGRDFSIRLGPLRAYLRALIAHLRPAEDLASTLEHAVARELIAALSETIA